VTGSRVWRGKEWDIFYRHTATHVTEHVTRTASMVCLRPFHDMRTKLDVEEMDNHFLDTNLDVDSR
jgi:transposase-like protein